jgi:hypothetical protein
VREWDALPQLQKTSVTALLKDKVEGVEVSFRLLENTVSFTPPAALFPAVSRPPPKKKNTLVEKRWKGLDISAKGNIPCWCRTLVTVPTDQQNSSGRCLFMCYSRLIGGGTKKQRKPKKPEGYHSSHLPLTNGFQSVPVGGVVRVWKACCGMAGAERCFQSIVAIGSECRQVSWT